MRSSAPSKYSPDEVQNAQSSPGFVCLPFTQSSMLTTNFCCCRFGCSEVGTHTQKAECNEKKLNPKPWYPQKSTILWRCVSKFSSSITKTWILHTLTRVCAAGGMEPGARHVRTTCFPQGIYTCNFRLELSDRNALHMSVNFFPGPRTVVGFKTCV